MAKAILKFKKSDSEDVVGYVLYMKDSSEELEPRSEATRIDLGNPGDTNGFIEVALNDLPGMASADGKYNFGVASVDDFGNESSLLIDGLQGITLDFVAPNPPTQASVYYI